MRGFAYRGTRLTSLARRVAAMLALVAVLVHALLPLLHQARAEVAPLDDAVVICSGFGVKVVQLAELESDKTGQPDKSRIYYCPLCLAQQIATAALLPADVVLLLPTLAGTATAFTSQSFVVPGGRYAAAHARAPPATA